MRHLAWLAEDDDVVRQELSDEWHAALARYAPEPFRSLGSRRSHGSAASHQLRVRLGNRRDPRTRSSAATLDHGRTVHNMEGTRDDVLARAERVAGPGSTRPTPTPGPRWTRARTPPGLASSRSIPGYEEGPRIAGVVEGARRHLPVLVVDDGSTDDTAAKPRLAGAAVIRRHPTRARERRFGRVSAGAEEGYDAVLTLDADGQHDPDEIPRFVAGTTRRVRRSAPELIIGRRDFARMPPVRRLSNTLGTAAFSWAVGQHVPDNQSGYRLLGRRLMAATLASDETGFEFEVEMIAVCLRSGWTLSWVPISTIYAGEPSHVRPVAHLRALRARDPRGPPPHARGRLTAARPSPAQPRRRRHRHPSITPAPPVHAGWPSASGGALHRPIGAWPHRPRIPRAT